VYERDTDAGGPNMNYRDMGVQRSRNFKAFKLWMSLQVFGVDAFRRAVDHGLNLAEKAEQILRSRPHWEIVTPATLGIVTFQYRLPDLSEDEIENMNEAMTTELCRTGYAYMSTTLLYGRKVQRLCLNRHDATEEDLLETISRLESIANSPPLAR
jgi:glutamate/tyrosine decarboxylase-like PLP-dependent enzyme